MSETPQHIFCREVTPNVTSTITLETQRLNALKEIAADICNVTPSEIFMLNTVQEMDEAFIERYRTADLRQFSDTLVEWRNALKSQLHVPFYQSSVPPWFNLTFAQQIQPCVLDGCVVFKKEHLKSAALDVLQRGHASVRIKLGIGRGGTDQFITNLESVNDIVERVLLLWTDADVHLGGIVVEQNVDNADQAFSFSSLDYPCQTLPLFSLGYILQREFNDHQKVYIGTTCIVLPSDADVLNLDLSLFQVQDPMFGTLSFQPSDVYDVQQVGNFVAESYRTSILGVFPRINLDLLKTNEGFRVIDPSLRLGGNSWCELRAVQRFKNQETSVCLHSIRIVYSKEHKAIYMKAWTHCRVLCETDDDDAFWYSMLICEHV